MAAGQSRKHWHSKHCPLFPECAGPVLFREYLLLLQVFKSILVLGKN